MKNHKLAYPIVSIFIDLPIAYISIGKTIQNTEILLYRDK